MFGRKKKSKNSEEVYTASSEYENTNDSDIADKYADNDTEFESIEREDAQYYSREYTESESEHGAEAGPENASEAFAGRTDMPDAKKVRSRTKRQIVVISVLISAVFIYMIYFFASYALGNESSLFSNSYNQRDDLRLQEVRRGRICAEDGEVLAETVTNNDGSAYRYYPYGSIFSHVIGYTINGGAGLEKYSKYYLLNSDISLVDKIGYDRIGQRYPGNDVITTLNTTLQTAAANALGTYRGAIVVSDPTTGEILALVSKPDYDPNYISDSWEYLNSDEDESVTLLNRATMGMYPPGSTFKIVDTIELLTEDPDQIFDYSYDCEGIFTKDDESIYCYQHNVHGTLDLEESFIHSCNGSFANIGFMLDKARLRNLCSTLYFGKDISFELPTSVSSINIPDDISTKEMIQISIGQGTTGVTPLHMNMITAAVANGGVMLEPYLIKRVQTADGAVIMQNSTSRIGRVMSETVAANLRQFMTKTVTSGTALNLSNSSYTAAGKTGSAEYDEENNSHAWFTGFAPAENPQICITVIVEGAESGGAVAVPMARQVLDAYFNNY